MNCATFLSGEFNIVGRDYYGVDEKKKWREGKEQEQMRTTSKDKEAYKQHDNTESTK